MVVAAGLELNVRLGLPVESAAILEDKTTSALSDFTDFLNAPGPSFLTTPSDVVNEAMKNTYLMGALKA